MSEHDKLRRPLPPIPSTVDESVLDEPTIPVLPSDSSKLIPDSVRRLRDEHGCLYRSGEALFSDVSAERAAAIQALMGTEISFADGKKYTINRLLSDRGVMSRVFLAADSAAGGVDRVLKIGHPAARSMQHTTSTDRADHRTETVQARSPYNEIAALTRLTKLAERNPGPQLVDAQFVQEPGNLDRQLPMIVMEHLVGSDPVTFARLLTDPIAKATLIKKILEAITLIHKQGIIHGDIKPENIVVNETGDPRIIDFGTAVITDLRAKQAAIPLRFGSKSPSYAKQSKDMGTPGYTLRDELISVERDCYAAGRTITAMLPSPPVTELDRQFAKIAERLADADPAQRLTLQAAIESIDTLLRAA